MEQKREGARFLCIFNMSTVRQSVLSEVLGICGKTWTNDRGGGEEQGRAGEVKGWDE